jgi:hypothetical protein
VLGGCDLSGDRNDIWYSTDGATWTCATDSAGWSAREHHTAIVFDDKLWVLGGKSGNSNKNDVWCSSDGVNWEPATDSAGWSKRHSHTSEVYDNKIWVLGGNADSYKNDVWFSCGFVGIEAHNIPVIEPLVFKAIYPSPFNARTQVAYTLTKPSQVKLSIYNRAGQKVKELVNGQQETGVHNAQWTGEDDSGKNLPAGVYLIRLETKGFTTTKKIVKLE